MLVYGWWLVASLYVRSNDGCTEGVLVPVAHQHTVAIGLRHDGREIARGEAGQTAESAAEAMGPITNGRSLKVESGESKRSRRAKRMQCVV